MHQRTNILFVMILICIGTMVGCSPCRDVIITVCDKGTGEPLEDAHIDLSSAFPETDPDDCPYNQTGFTDKDGVWQHIIHVDGAGLLNIIVSKQGYIKRVLFVNPYSFENACIDMTVTLKKIKNLEKDFIMKP